MRGGHNHYFVKKGLSPQAYLLLVGALLGLMGSLTFLASIGWMLFASITPQALLALHIGLLMYFVAEGAAASRVIPYKTKFGHFFRLFVQTAIVVYTCTYLLRALPWIVALGFAFLLTIAMLTSRLLVDLSTANRQLSLVLWLFICAPLSAIMAYFMYTTPWFGAWVLTPAMAMLILLNGAMIWYFRRDGPLSQGQHQDVWPPLITGAPAHTKWSSIEHYDKEHPIPSDALKAILQDIDLPTLLLYFKQHGPENGRARSNLARGVQERICVLEPRAIALFELYPDCKDAMAMLENMLALGDKKPESFALPDLDLSATQ